MKLLLTNCIFFVLLGGLNSYLLEKIRVDDGAINMVDLFKAVGDLLETLFLLFELDILFLYLLLFIVNFILLLSQLFLLSFEGLLHLLDLLLLNLVLPVTKFDLLEHFISSCSFLS